MRRQPAIVVLALAVASVLLPSEARSQDRPFLFSVSTAHDPSSPSLHVDYDFGVGQGEFTSGHDTAPEQRLAVQGSWNRLTMVARVGVASTDSTYQSSQSGEVLVSLLAPSKTGTSLAAGGGLLHEAEGTNVLLTRVTASRETPSWRLHGNVVFEMPLAAPGRDAVDIITTVGWARRLTPAVALGVEGLGEDLEGFWDPHEAEGGARVLVGPALHIAPGGRRWQFSATGGPIFHSPTAPTTMSDALRDLPLTSARISYAVRGGVTFQPF
jgi:hypothetical protein